MADSFALDRFLHAQEPVMPTVLAELRAGRKRTHWMWFVFPQLRQLGRSPTALHFGILSLDEARAFAAHPVLGPRLATCAQLVCDATGRSAHDILGSPDDLKLRSSMTLFAAAAPHVPVFVAVLGHHFGGMRDPLTTTLLAGG